MTEEQKKAYDLKELAKHLKAQGLDLLEDGAEKAFIAVKGWLIESAQISKTPFDDIIVVAMPQVEKLALEAIDKIDGQEG